MGYINENLLLTYCMTTHIDSFDVRTALASSSYKKNMHVNITVHHYSSPASLALMIKL